MAKQIPTCTNNAQTLPALMNAVLNSSVVDNGAVVVGLLPKHCCCAGGCESKEKTHDVEGGVETWDKKHSFKDGIEYQEGGAKSQEGGAKSQEDKHCLEGLWQESSSPETIFLVQTVQDRPGYLFGKVMCGNHYGNDTPQKVPHFFFSTSGGIVSGDGITKEMKGQFLYGPVEVGGCGMTFDPFSFLRSFANWFFCFQLTGLKKSCVGVQLMSSKFRGLVLLRRIRSISGW